MRWLDQFNFHSTLAKSPGVCLVIFTSPGCGACRRWKQLLEDAHDASPAFQLYEVDAQRDQALAREFDIFHLPAMFIYVDGVYHRPLNSAADPAAFRRALDAALAAAPLEPP